jgi:hypothetical protein
MNGETILTDMAACEPSSALSTTQETGKWYLVDYETDDGMTGTMMYSDSREEAPIVSLPLNATGWHKVYVGINYSRLPGEGPRGGARLKLSSDPEFTEIGPEVVFRWALGHYESKMGTEKVQWGSVYEAYWKSALLDGESMVLGATRYARPESWGLSNVTWVRLVPMSEKEVKQRESDQPRPDTKNLAACYCLGDITGPTNGSDMYHPTDPGYITEKIEAFRDSDFKLLLLECIRGDVCTFNSKIGRVSDDGAWDPSWIDPLEVAIEHAHDCGLDVYVSLRMVGTTYPFKFSPLQENRYSYENRQYALKDEKGRLSSVLSLAYPNIRERWVSLLREAVQYGADGAHLCFNRASPFCLYEEPVRDSFIEKYGVDPVTLDYEDERWLRHRAGFVTQFIRDVRAMLDEEGERMGRRLGFAVTFYRKPSPLYHASDVETWAKEGLVDYLMPHWVHLAEDDGPAIVSEFKKLFEGTSVQLMPDIYPRTPPGEEYAKGAKSMYEAGADGFSFWSAEMRTTRASEWAVVRRLGHQESMDRYIDEAPTYWRRVGLRELDGVTVRHSHNDG